jgi:secreted PhoX family phosphatase
LTLSCCGDVLVAEDGGDMQVVAILPDGTLKPLLQVTGHSGSEITGPAFDPSGTRLYFSSQRGPSGGVTYEVTGPFHLPAA